MKDLKEFYSKYNLNHEYCSMLFSVGSKSLIKYSNGEKLREDTVKRIETGINVIEKYNLVRPHCPVGFVDVFERNEWYRANRKYMRETKEMIERERASL